VVSLPGEITDHAVDWVALQHPLGLLQSQAIDKSRVSCQRTLSAPRCATCTYRSTHKNRSGEHPRSVKHHSFQPTNHLPLRFGNMNHSGQFGQGVPATAMHPGHEAGGQSLNAAGYGYDQYQSMSSGSGANNLSVSTTPASTPHSHNYNSECDVPMEDADPYNRAKYPSRPAHHHRASSQYIAHEGSAAAQRYSPMNMLNPAGQFPTSPNAQSQPQAQAGYTYQSHTPRSRQSPTRQNHLGSPQQYMESPSKQKPLP